MAGWRGAVRPHYPWLLSPGRVQAGLHQLMAAEAATAAAAVVGVLAVVRAAAAAGAMVEGWALRRR